MMVDQQLDQRIRLRAARLHRQQRRRAGPLGAFVRLLARIELGVDEEAVLEIVDAQRHRLRIGDRAQMAGNLQIAPVRLVDRRLSSARVMFI